MTRSANFLAALASAALPGLDPTSVQIVRARPGDPYDVAYVVDTQERQWVVKAPRTPVAGALLEDAVELSALLGRRLDIAIPTIKGQVVVPEGRAVVHARLPGRPLDFAQLPPGLGLAADVGRALAHVHNLEIALFDEASRPSYDAEATRARRLTDLDRAAATGHVPTGLLARWERSLEDVSLWRFVPTPVHGGFTGANVLASFDDESDADAGRVVALLGWEDAHVGDPAEDFCELAALTSPAALHSVLEAYGPSRIDRPDRHLLARARLGSEMALLRRLLSASAADDAELVDRVAQDLRSLDERVFAHDDRGQDGLGRARTHGTGLDPFAAADPVGAAEAPAAPGAGLRDRLPAGRSAGSSEGGDPRPSTASSDMATVAVPVLEVVKGGQLTPSSGVGGGAPDPAVPENAPDQAAARAHADDESTPGSPDGTDAPDLPAPPRVPAAHFEIDEAEPLDDEGLLDLHEGASEFVPVEQRPRSAEQSNGTH